DRSSESRRKAAFSCASFPPIRQRKVSSKSIPSLWSGCLPSCDGGGKHLPVPAANLAAAMPGPHPPCGHLPPCDGGRKGSPVPVVRLIPRSPFPCTTLLSGRKTQAFLPPPAGVRGEAPGMAPALRSEEGARRADGGHHRPISNACRILAST